MSSYEDLIVDAMVNLIDVDDEPAVEVLRKLINKMTKIENFDNFDTCLYSPKELLHTAYAYDDFKRILVDLYNAHMHNPCIILR